MDGILLSCLGQCSYLLLGIVRKATKMNMQDCWSFTCCLSCSLGSSLKCSQVFSMAITLVEVHLNWLNWFHFLIPEGDLLIILRDFIFFVTMHSCFCRCFSKGFFDLGRAVQFHSSTLQLYTSMSRKKLWVQHC